MAERQFADGPTLEVKDIDTFYRDLHVLKKACLRLEEGEIVALFGPNGHGKSTLLKTISGVLAPRSGSIRFRGQEIAGAPTEKTVDLGIAYIPEERNLFVDMTVLENLMLGAYNARARKDLESNLQFVFSLFPRLSERTNQSASTLSGGEGRMLAVGRGLMTAASLLLVDEPSIGLSPLLKKVVFDAIERIGKETGATILVVEQEVDYALRLARRVYLLRKGSVILEKHSNEIDKEQIEKAYF
jgi:branched-chain amino acid transport system ATP-binding protein